MIQKINKIMKNKLLFFVFFLFGMMLAGNISAQEPIQRSKEITKIGGKEYYLHHVKAGQTLFSLAQTYNLTVGEIEMFNPEVKNGLKVGHVLGIPVRPVAEPQAEPVAEPEPVVVEPEPKSEPVVVKPEPEPEPIVVKPEPEPEPELIVDNPEPEPIVIKTEPEPEPEPVVVKPDPEPEPVVVKPDPEPELVVVKPEPEPVVVEPEPEPVVVAPQPSPSAEVEKKVDSSFLFVAGNKVYRVVQPNESLYDIAKECGIDVVELKSFNHGLTNDPLPGTKIAIPNVINDNDYIVHHCEKNERASSLTKRWGVDEGEFREKNISVGSHVFENQVVLIPITPVTDFYWIAKEPIGIVELNESEEEVTEPEPEPEHQTWLFDEELDESPQCYAAPENASRRYKVALMVPLYLNDIGKLDVAKEDVPKAMKSRSLSFLQFYEGFMMAVKELEKEGLRLDLQVLDVTDNAASAERAVNAIDGEELDLIVGPFYHKAFTVVEEYAKTKGIIVVNPLSSRETVIADNPNVVKVKPDNVGLVMAVSNLVRNRYQNANVFVISKENPADSLFLNQLEYHLNLAINKEVEVSGNELLEYARNESKRLEMGSRLVPTVDVEGTVYSTNDIKDGTTQMVVLDNSVKRFALGELSDVTSQLSGVRDNVIVAYGDDNVFATQILNSFAKETDRYPITLVCFPDWSKFEKLLVSSLLQMNAIYVSDYFIDYNDDAVKRFVLNFRGKYASEPQKYAFQGYDVGYYFLSCMMRYGSENLLDCLHCHQVPLMHTQYRFYYRNFLSSNPNDGKENMFWNTYQYDNELIELKPVNAYEKETEETEE